MIGIILCCHGDMGQGLKNAVELIIGHQEKFISTGIYQGESCDNLSQVIKKHIQDMDANEGVLILTDLLGGTPYNVTALLLNKNIEMITGFNLPMLLKILLARKAESKLADIVSMAIEHGRKCIISSRELINGVK